MSNGTNQAGAPRWCRQRYGLNWWASPAKAQRLEEAQTSSGGPWRAALGQSMLFATSVRRGGEWLSFSRCSIHCHHHFSSLMLVAARSPALLQQLLRRLPLHRRRSQWTLSESDRPPCYGTAPPVTARPPIRRLATTHPSPTPLPTRQELRAWCRQRYGAWTRASGRGCTPCKLESRHVAHAGVSDEPRASASMSTRDGGGPLTVCIVILVSDAVIFLLV